MVEFPTPVAHSIEALPADSPLRQAYPEDVYPNGSYYPSPFGRVRYWIVGPEDGHKVVLIHGISLPSIVHKNVADALAAKGFRVLLYDLYGRGYSEAPQVPQDPNLFTLQLALLMQFIGWKSADIYGYSMGGGIAAAFAASFPHLVRINVVFVASVGLMEKSRVLGTGNPSTHNKPPASQQAAKNTDVVADDLFTTLSDLFALQTEHLPGFKKAFEDSRIGGVLTDLHGAFEAVSKLQDKRFLIVHGTDDQIVPYGEVEKMKKYIPQAEVVAIEGGSHSLPVEDGSRQRLVESVVAFLSV